MTPNSRFTTVFTDLPSKIILNKNVYMQWVKLWHVVITSVISSDVSHVYVQIGMHLR